MMCSHISHLFYSFCILITKIRNPDSIGTSGTRLSKRIGDAPFVPESQTAGSSTINISPEGWHSFATVARGYRIEGAPVTDICHKNAQVRIRNLKLLFN